MVEHIGSRVMVREKMVSFTSTVIKAYYIILDIPETDEYVTYASGIVDYDADISGFCYQGSVWKLTNGKPVHFKASQLLTPARAWYYFVLTNVLPSGHAIDVTKERAIMVYAIIQGMFIDIG
ncbi:putative S-locus lectin protein kinase family protein [Quillaja saponaria]|uniref:S-locus lectin protein kinase family protein n=1 Tax=Quillaja saponaria TaxID=32244 RepID=A0AAD7VHT6_QUISA|nr:putative S-locus lectin protein kinase family protein [Quillaja saponaria]